MSKLSESDIETMLSECPEWERDAESGAIVRNLEFPTFADAISFVNRIAPIADAQDHHPDIDIRYRRLRVALISHDVGGLTKRDRRMAGLIDQELSNSD